jgi:hypothetical protein
MPPPPEPREGDAVVEAVDGGGGGPNDGRLRVSVLAGLEEGDEASNVGVDVRRRVLHGVAHAGLRREVEHVGEGHDVEELGQEAAVVDVALHDEHVVAAQQRAPRLLERGVAVGVEAVDADDAVAALAERQRAVRAHEARGARDEHGQPQAPTAAAATPTPGSGAPSAARPRTPTKPTLVQHRKTFPNARRAGRVGVHGAWFCLSLSPTPRPRLFACTTRHCHARPAAAAELVRDEHRQGAAQAVPSDRDAHSSPYLLRSRRDHRQGASYPPTAGGGAGVADSSSAQTSSPASLVRQVASSGVDPSPALRELAAYLSDDDFEKNALVGDGRVAETVASVLWRRAEETGVEGMEVATRVLALILASDGIDDSNKKQVATGLAADAAASTASLARVNRGGSGLEARIDAARLAELLLVNAAGEAKAAATKSSELLAKLVRLVGTVDETGALDRNAVDTSLSCLAAICGSCRVARGEMVRHGAVPAVVRALQASTESGASAKALRVLESTVGCAEARAALCANAEDTIPAVVGKMMKAGHDDAEAAVAVL